MNAHTHTLIAAGGGTGGSVSPLLAMLEAFPDAAVHWIGTKGHWTQELEMVSASLRGPPIAIGGPWQSQTNGHPELVEGSRNVTFHQIFSGKLRRYWDIQNLLDPFRIAGGFFQSLHILWRMRPCAVLTAGSYVAVPVAWAAWVLRIPVVVYQQDAYVGLANRLMMPIAGLVQSIEDGALVRSDRLNGDVVRARSRWKLEKGLPTVLVIGGGTGSVFLNDLVIENLAVLTEFCQIIHITGDAKRHAEPPHCHPEPSRRIPPSQLPVTSYQLPHRYHSFPFLGPELADAYAAADLVVTRAGMGVLTELAANKKAAIVIPLPNTHQEQNAKLLETNDAAVVLHQRHPELVEGSRFVSTIASLLADTQRSATLEKNLARLFPRMELTATKARLEHIMRCQ